MAELLRAILLGTPLSDMVDISERLLGMEDVLETNPLAWSEEECRGKQEGEGREEGGNSCLHKHYWVVAIYPKEMQL